MSLRNVEIFLKIFLDMDCGCDFATPMSNGALIRMFLLKEILAYK